MGFKLSPFFQALAAILIFLGGIFILFGPGPVFEKIDDLRLAADPAPSLDQKVYVAVEDGAKIAVIDPVEMVVVKNINLSGLMPHNVQVSPDNKTVWVTANAGAHGHSLRVIERADAHGNEEIVDDGTDKILVIDSYSDAVIQTISIGEGIHLAHIVLTPDSKFAYATAQNESVVYKINAKTYEIVGKIAARSGNEPHGLRISPDGRFAYIAMLKGRSLGIVDLNTDWLSEIPLGGAAVQTGVAPNGKYVVASLYDTKQLAVYNIAGKSIDYIDLPQNAKGPIQMYFSPDSKYAYLADQGYYFGEPVGELVYKIDIEAKTVVKEIKTGKAPHGVVVSGDGKFVYVTNLLSGDVSVIDTEKDAEVKKIKVGEGPNGISIWYK